MQIKAARTKLCRPPPRGTEISVPFSLRARENTWVSGAKRAAVDWHALCYIDR